MLLQCSTVLKINVVTMLYGSANQCYDNVFQLYNVIIPNQRIWIFRLGGSYEIHIFNERVGSRVFVRPLIRYGSTEALTYDWWNRNVFSLLLNCNRVLHDFLISVEREFHTWGPETAKPCSQIFEVGFLCQGPDNTLNDVCSLYT